MGLPHPITIYRTSYAAVTPAIYGKTTPFTQAIPVGLHLPVRFPLRACTHRSPYLVPLSRFLADLQLVTATTHLHTPRLVRLCHTVVCHICRGLNMPQMPRCCLGSLNKSTYCPSRASWKNTRRQLPPRLLMPLQDRMHTKHTALHAGVANMSHLCHILALHTIPPTSHVTPASCSCTFLLHDVGLPSTWDHHISTGLLDGVGLEHTSTHLLRAVSGYDIYTCLTTGFTPHSPSCIFGGLAHATPSPCTVPAHVRSITLHLPAAPSSAPRCIGAGLHWERPARLRTACAAALRGRTLPRGTCHAAHRAPAV